MNGREEYRYRLSIRVTERQRAWLWRRCRQEHRSLGNLLRLLIEREMEELSRTEVLAKIDVVGGR